MSRGAVVAIVIGVLVAIGVAYVARRGAPLAAVGRDAWTHEMTIHSDALGRDMRALIFEPPGLPSCATKRLLVLFHGRGGDERQWMEGGLGDGVGVDAVARRLIEAGTIPPV